MLLFLFLSLMILDEALGPPCCCHAAGRPVSSGIPAHHTEAAVCIAHYGHDRTCVSHHCIVRGVLIRQGGRQHHAGWLRQLFEELLGRHSVRGD